jgi:hypothetical protein
MAWGNQTITTAALALAVSLGAVPAASASAEDTVVLSPLLDDAETFPALLGLAVNAGIGLPLTLLGYPEVTGPISQEVVPAATEHLNRLGEPYGGLLTAARSAEKALGPIVNPAVKPLLDSAAQAMQDSAPGSGIAGSMGHFGTTSEDKRKPAADQTVDAEPDTINFAIAARAVPTRMYARVPLEADGGAEAKLDIGNGYGSALAQITPGPIPAALLWSKLGFFSGTLIPHPAVSQSNFPSGPTSDSTPIVVAGQTDSSRWGTFETSVDGEGRGRATAVGGSAGSPEVWRADSFLSDAVSMREGNKVSTELVSTVVGLDVAGVLHVDKLVSRLSASGDGSAEGRSTKFVPTITGATIGGVPVVITGSGVSVGGAEAMAPKQRQAAEQQVNDALSSSGMSVTIAPAEPRDNMTAGGATAGMSGAALRVVFNRPDQPQQYQIDFGMVESSVFVGLVGSPGEEETAFDAGSSTVSAPLTAPPATAGRLAPPSALQARRKPAIRPPLGAATAPSAEPWVGQDDATGPVPTAQAQATRPAASLTAMDPIATGKKVRALYGWLLTMGLAVAVVPPLAIARRLRQLRG